MLCVRDLNPILGSPKLHNWARFYSTNKINNILKNLTKKSILLAEFNRTVKFNATLTRKTDLCQGAFTPNLTVGFYAYTTRVGNEKKGIIISL